MSKEIWKEIAIPKNLVAGEYGKATKIFTPKSYGDYTFFMPSKCVGEWKGMAFLKYSESFTFTLNRPEYDRYGKRIGWIKEKIDVEEFESIWENIAIDVHHVPKHLYPVQCDADPELVDE